MMTANDIRVCHVVLTLDPGGLERLVLNLVSRPELRGIRSTVCCLQRRGALADAVNSARVDVSVVETPASFDITYTFRLASFFRREKIDVVHTHRLDPMFYAGLAAVFAGVKTGTRSQHNVQMD